MKSRLQNHLFAKYGLDNHQPIALLAYVRRKVLIIDNGRRSTLLIHVLESRIHPNNHGSKCCERCTCVRVCVCGYACALTACSYEDSALTRGKVEWSNYGGECDAIFLMNIVGTITREYVWHFVNMFSILCFRCNCLVN